MRLAPLLVIGILALTAAACGPSGGDDSTGDDTAGAPDANNNNNAPDANTTTGPTQIGDSCTPDAADPMGAGSCDAGFTCLSLQGGSGAWCTKQCDPAADTCATGYTGAGQPQCVFGITFTQGGTPVNMCGVICNDLPGDPQVCNPATACTGACPGTLACTQALNDQSNNHVADACF